MTYTVSLNSWEAFLEWERKHARYLTRNGIRVNAEFAALLDKLGYETERIWRE